MTAASHDEADSDVVDAGEELLRLLSCDDSKRSTLPSGGSSKRATAGGGDEAAEQQREGEEQQQHEDEQHAWEDEDDKRFLAEMKLSDGTAEDADAVWGGGAVA